MAANASYNLLEILLTDCHFTRAETINTAIEGYNINYNIETGYDVAEEKLFAWLGIKVGGLVENDKPMYSIEVRMVGIFSYSPDADLPLERFANINAPAIIFPFIREQIATISLKSGIKPTILLPPINFVKMAEENKA
jgi:preprotein translocase subunit SecB